MVLKSVKMMAGLVMKSGIELSDTLVTKER